MENETVRTYNLNLVGDKTKQTYMGNFQIKCILSPLDQISADKIYRELLGDNLIHASPSAKNIAFALSQLKVRIEKPYPPFWESQDFPGSHIPDQNILFDLLNKAIEYQEEFESQKAEEYQKMQDRLQNAIKNKEIEPEREEIDPTEELETL